MVTLGALEFGQLLRYCAPARRSTTRAFIAHQIDRLELAVVYRSFRGAGSGTEDGRSRSRSGPCACMGPAELGGERPLRFESTEPDHLRDLVSDLIRGALSMTAAMSTASAPGRSPTQSKESRSSER